jgi:hypothetical protein
VARNGGDYNNMQLAVDEVRSWFRRNPLDAHWVIGSINGW